MSASLTLGLSEARDALKLPLLVLLLLRLLLLRLLLLRLLLLRRSFVFCVRAPLDQ